jgi:hypothetical protein
MVDAAATQTNKRGIRWAERWWRFWVPAKPHVVTAIVVAALIAAIVFAVRYWNFFGLGGSSGDEYGWADFAEDVGRFTAIAAGLWAVTAASLQRLSPSVPKGAQAFLESQEDPMKLLRQRFSKLLKRAGRPLAIFIDDLDRCEPEYVVGLLEGTRLSLGTSPSRMLLLVIGGGSKVASTSTIRAWQRQLRTPAGS